MKKEKGIFFIENIITIELHGALADAYYPLVLGSYYVRRRDGKMVHYRSGWRPLSVNEEEFSLFHKKEDVLSAMTGFFEERAKENIICIDKTVPLSTFREYDEDRKLELATSLSPEILAKDFTRIAFENLLEFNEVLREGITLVITEIDIQSDYTKPHYFHSSDELWTFIYNMDTENREFEFNFDAIFSLDSPSSEQILTWVNRFKSFKIFHEYYVIKYDKTKYSGGLTDAFGNEEEIMVGSERAALKFLTEDQAIQYAIYLNKKGYCYDGFSIAYRENDELGCTIPVDENDEPHWYRHKRGRALNKIEG